MNRFLNRLAGIVREVEEGGVTDEVLEAVEGLLVGLFPTHLLAAGAELVEGRCDVGEVRSHVGAVVGCHAEERLHVFDDLW